MQRTPKTQLLPEELLPSRMDRNGLGGSVERQALVMDSRDAPTDKSNRSRHEGLQSVPVVLTDMDIPGLALARQLGRRGVPVIGLDAESRRWTHHTRYAKITASPGLADESQLKAMLDSIADTWDERPMLVPLHDDHVLFVSRNRDELARRFRFVLPPEDVVEALVDKARFASWCRENQVSTPATWFPENDEALREAAESARYPAILKPVESRSWQSAEAGAAVGWQKAIVVENAAQLYEEFERLRVIDDRMILQEIVPGPDANLHYVVTYIARDGTWCGGFVGRKLRTNPPHFGRGCYVESVEAPDLIAHARTILLKLGYRGNVGLEFKYDERDGDWKLLEINARFGMWDGFAGDCGLDLVGAAYEDALGQQPSPRKGYRVGRRWVNLDADISAAAGYVREGQLRPAAWAASVLRPHASPAFALDDPFPWLVRRADFIKHIVRAGIRMLLKRLRRS